MEKVLLLPPKIEDANIIQVHELLSNLANVSLISVFESGITGKFKGIIFYDYESWYWLENANFDTREAYDTLPELLDCIRVKNPYIKVLTND